MKTNSLQYLFKQISTKCQSRRQELLLGFGFILSSIHRVLLYSKQVIMQCPLGTLIKHFGALVFNILLVSFWCQDLACLIVEKSKIVENMTQVQPNFLVYWVGHLRIISLLYQRGGGEFGLKHYEPILRGCIHVSITCHIFFVFVNQFKNRVSCLLSY